MYGTHEHGKASAEAPVEDAAPKIVKSKANRVAAYIAVGILAHALSFQDKAYGHKKPTHLRIASEAFRIWPPVGSSEYTEMNEYLGSTDAGTYGDPATGGYILEGAWEEDEYDSIMQIEFVRTRDSGIIFYSHFWNPDAGPDSRGLDGGLYPLNPFLVAFHGSSALFDAKIYWDAALSAYAGAVTGSPQLDRAYYLLGRITHLLEDMSVPAHVLLDPHVDVFGDLSRDSYEVYAGSAANFVSSSGPPVDSSSVYDLFNGMAQRAQYFPSNDSETDPLDRTVPRNYTGPGVDVGWFVGWPTVGPGMDVDWTDGFSDPELALINERLMPYAIRSVAGLYKLFWKSTHAIASPTAGEPMSGIMNLIPDTSVLGAADYVRWAFPDTGHGPFQRDTPPYSLDWDSRLVPNGPLRIEMRAFDSEGLMVAFGRTDVAVLNGSSERPVIISGPSVPIVDETTALVEWVTDKPGDSEIEYGLTPSYGEHQIQIENATDHSILLANLISGRTYHYRVRTTDADGRASNWSPDRTFETTGGGEEETIYVTGFEQTLDGSGWKREDIDPRDGDVFWARTTRRRYSGAYSVYCAGSSGNTQYADYMRAHIRRRVDLSAYESAVLTYRAWVQCESASDYLSIEAADDVESLNWVEQQRISPGGASWTQGAVNLSQYVNQQMWISFHFKSNGTNHAYEGAYVDDVAITGLRRPNRRPTIPIVGGPETGKPHEDLQFCASSTDLDGDSLTYKFDWGDGAIGDWTSPCATHVYDREASFDVRAKARDDGTPSLETAWSEGHGVGIGLSPIIALIPDGVVFVGEEYRMSPALVEGTAPVIWTVIAGPIGVLADDLSGTITWIPSSDQVGDNPFTIASANAFGEDERSWTVTVGLRPGKLEVLPEDGLESTGPIGGPFSPPSATYTLSHAGDEAIAWSVEAQCDWITSSSNAGTLNPHFSEELTLVINKGSASLPAGSHCCLVAFTNLTTAIGTTGREICLDVGVNYDLNVTSSPEINVSIHIEPTEDRITPFRANYVENTELCMTAPKSAGCYSFLRWSLDNVGQPLAELTLCLTMDSFHFAVARYEASCNDSVFCNGVEFCGLDARCQRGSPPCTIDECCDEREKKCASCCPPLAAFTQPPGNQAFVISDTLLGSAVLDNFNATADMICGLRWWGMNRILLGGEWVDCVRDPDGYDVTFLTRSLEMACEFKNTVPAKEAAFPLDASTVYQYDLSLEPCCEITNGWVSIVGGPTEFPCWFLWVESPVGDGFALRRELVNNETSSTNFDGSLCLVGSQCGNGICETGEDSCTCRSDCVGDCCMSDADCDDDQPCTDDRCQLGIGCVSTPDESNSCDDGLFCNGIEFCGLDGSCHPGANPCVSEEPGCDEGADRCSFGFTGTGGTIPAYGIGVFELFMEGSETAVITSLEVDINGLIHSEPRDLDIYLIDPRGIIVELMTDRCGRRSVSDINITFSDQADSLLPEDGPASSGIYLPEGLGLGRDQGFATYIGSTMGSNGWILLVIDDAPDDGGSFESFRLRGSSTGNAPDSTRDSR